MRLRKAGVCSSDAPVNALGTCANETDCGGNADTTRYCAPSVAFPVGGITVPVTDQFSGRDLTALRPVELCNPVDKNGGGIKDPNRHLVCYKVKGSVRPPRVQVNNQFGPHLLRLKSETKICVVAGKRLL